MDRIRYIHYGSSELRPITPIKNRPMFTKPDGGLWASNVDSPRGWEEWCRSNDFNTDSLKESFTFTLTEDAKILHLYSVKQLEDLPKAPIHNGLEALSVWVNLDFEKLEEEYDGIELHLSEEKYEDIGDGWSSGLYYQLYGWDCDSIVVFHDNVIKVMKE